MTTKGEIAVATMLLIWLIGLGMQQGLRWVEGYAERDDIRTGLKRTQLVYYHMGPY